MMCTKSEKKEKGGMELELERVKVKFFITSSLYMYGVLKPQEWRKQ